MMIAMLERKSTYRSSGGFGPRSSAVSAARIIKYVRLAWHQNQSDHPIRRFTGGESDAGKDLAASIADVYLLNGRPVEELEPIIADMRQRAAARARSLRYGIAGFVICRETEAAAQAELARLAGLKRGKVIGGDPHTVMHQNRPAAALRVGINGGTDAGLVGSAVQIADRMHRMASLGIDTFLLQFHPTREELERFGAEVIPLLRR